MAQQTLEIRKRVIAADQEFVAPPPLPRSGGSHVVFLVNFRNSGDIYPPFGIMYVADALAQVDIGCELFHPVDSGVDALVERVAAERPLFVGLSTITGPQLLPTIEASRRIHALGVPVVWGGVHSTIMPSDVLAQECVDFVVINEGEVTTQELALALAGDLDRQWSDIVGLAWKDEDGVHENCERPFIPDLDVFTPRWDLLDDVEAYLIKSGPYQRALPVYISRGCPFRCAFCYNEVVMKRTWRQHSDDFVVDQVRWLQETHGIDAVDFADDYLFGRLRPMKRLVEKVGLPWSGQVRVQLLNEHFVAWLHETDCQWVNIGAESGSQAMLDLITKDQKDWQIEWGIKNLIAGAPEIEANLSFIVGLPHERDSDRKITFDLIEGLCAQSDNVRCSICVYMPYPGTPLWSEALQAGFVTPTDQEQWAALDLDRGNTPWVDDAEAQAMCDVNDVLFVGRSQGHRVLAPYYALLRWRWRNRRFGHYWEGHAKRALTTGRLAPVVDRVTRRLVSWNSNTHKGDSGQEPPPESMSPSRVGTVVGSGPSRST